MSFEKINKLFLNKEKLCLFNFYPVNSNCTIIKMCVTIYFKKLHLFKNYLILYLPLLMFTHVLMNITKDVIAVNYDTVILFVS